MAEAVLLGRATSALGVLALLCACSANEDRSDKIGNQATASSPIGQPATSTEGETDAKSDEQALLDLEHAYSQAMIRRDRAFLERYYAADWRGGNWLGFWTKATMLKAVLSDRYVTKSVTLRDLRARVEGDVGIVQGVSDEITRVDGRDTSGRWSFTDIFRKADGRWQAIASHTSELRPNESPPQD